MIKLAIRGNEKFEVDDFEVKRKGISYSIDTIHHFLTKYNYTKFFFLIGSDQVSKFDEWKDYKEILKNVRLCIALRPGQDLNASFEKNIQKLTINNDEKPYIIKSPLIDISSTKIRDRIANGLSVRYLVPESVSGYINQHNLYQK
jgi:nicotinate-nucleotide adenylyltransferase